MDKATRESEEVDVEIFEDPPEITTPPSQQVVVDGIQDDAGTTEGEGLGDDLAPPKHRGDHDA